jgi:hypothetical protein
MKNISQTKTINIVKKIFSESTKFRDMRFIKIHGSQYQESGLPDLLILTITRMYQDRVIFWLEVKRTWIDHPAAIQQFNINDLRYHGFRTGYVVGDEFKHNWSDPIIHKLKEVVG